MCVSTTRADTTTENHNFQSKRQYSCVGTVPRVPLIEDLTSGPVPAGSQLLVEYDPASQWYNASLTIMAGWLKTGGTGTYHTYAQPPDDVRSQLRRLGVDSNTPEKYETSKEFPPLILD